MNSLADVAWSPLRVAGMMLGGCVACPDPIVAGDLYRERDGQRRHVGCEG